MSTASPARGLHAQVVAWIGQMIADGEVAPGEVLVPEEVGTRFGVSRTVVRESLRVLQAKGMLLARPNVGTRVRPPAEWDLLDPDVISWRERTSAGVDQRRELLELRAAVEPTAARFAARRADPVAVAGLVEAFEAMGAALEEGSVRAFTVADVRFHALLLAASGNQLFAQLAGALGAFVQVRDGMFESPDEVSRAALTLHGRVMAAVRTRDEEEAERAMREIVAAAARGDA